MINNSSLAKKLVQQAITDDFGGDVKLVTIFFPNNKECLVKTNNEELKWLHGEFSSWCGKECWSFDEHHSEDFSTTAKFHTAYGYGA